MEGMEYAFHFLLSGGTIRMTRINVVPVDQLHDMHLLGENKEITRVFTLVRNAQAKGKNKWNVAIPSEYTMGTGHVRFFYDKLGYVLDRYHAIVEEMRRRGFSPNPVPDEDLKEGIHQHWFGSYVPTQDAIYINQQRIYQRLSEMENS